MVVRITEEVPADFFGEHDTDAAPSRWTSTSDMRFTRWGEPATVDTPDVKAVDLTPWIEEEELAEWDAIPLLGLRRLRAGYELLNAGTTRPDAEADAGECPEVDLSYGNATEQDAAEESGACRSTPMVPRRPSWQQPPTSSRSTVRHSPSTASPRRHPSDFSALTRK